MSREEFANTFAGLFQGAAWAVDGAYAQRPFKDTGALREALQDSLFSGIVGAARRAAAFVP